MTKWLITSVSGTRGWEIVNFTGAGGAESRGIVDLLAVRKDHRALTVPRGDYFEMILIQVKGGKAAWPTDDDILRLRAVQARYNARHIVLATWKLGEGPTIYTLNPDYTPDPRVRGPRQEIWLTKTTAAQVFS